MNDILDLFVTFAYLGLISVGGAMTVIPEMERQVVTVHGWMTHAAFVEAYALGQFAPGPNMLHVFVVGYRVAGLTGAAAAGLGMFGPTSILLLGVAHVLGRPGEAGAPRLAALRGWLQHASVAMSPVTIGLMAAAAWTLGRGALHDLFTVALCAFAAIATGRKWLDPAVVVFGAAIAGAIWGGWAG